MSELAFVKLAVEDSRLHVLTEGRMMAELMITSETGMFHSACRCTYGNTEQWWGFQPAKPRTPVSDGKIDRKDRTSYINHFIKFDVAESVLKRAIRTASARYEQKKYVLGVTDCVSFSADVARHCGLRVPRVNMTPYGFIKVLSWWNDYSEFK